MSDNPKPFWLVVISDSMNSPPKCIECKDREAFETALKEHILGADEDLYAFAFLGDRIQLATPQPIGTYIVDGKAVQVGKMTESTDASGRIIPLVPKSGS
jgi:hypothetical protein